MIIQSQFTPAFGLRNSHLQTLLPTFTRNNLKFEGHQQTLELDDGDFIDLVWTENISVLKSAKPIVIIFHGLEGSIHSPYAKGMMLAIKQQGWVGLLMHFRGCSKNFNRLPRTYHSGETGDAKQLLNWLTQHYENHPLAAVGFSLGGNMLLKLQAELGETSSLQAAVSICAPVVLNNCADRLNSGFSKLYQHYLLGHLKRKVHINARRHDYETLINFKTKDIKNLKSFWLFDDLVTAPLHGFSGVDEYYSNCSARQYLQNIQKPALIIHALDDPFMTREIIPQISELSACTQMELSEHGGHVGFIGGSVFKPEYWLEKRVPMYLADYI